MACRVCLSLFVYCNMKKLEKGSGFYEYSGNNENETVGDDCLEMR